MSSNLTNPLDVDRLIMVDLGLSAPMTIPQLDTLELLQLMSPKNRLECITKWHQAWLIQLLERGK